jgi:hypothetical protein
MHGSNSFRLAVVMLFFLAWTVQLSVSGAGSAGVAGLGPGVGMARGAISGHGGAWADLGQNLWEWASLPAVCEEGLGHVTAGARRYLILAQLYSKTG